MSAIDKRLKEQAKERERIARWNEFMKYLSWRCHVAYLRNKAGLPV